MRTKDEESRSRSRSPSPFEEKSSKGRKGNSKKPTKPASTGTRGSRPSGWYPSEDSLIIRLKTQTTPPASLSTITEAVNALPESCGTHTINAVKKRWLNTLQHQCGPQMGNEEKRVLREAVREVERGMNKWKLVAEKYAELVKKEEEEEEEEGEREEKKENGNSEGKVGPMVKTLSVTQAKKWWADIEKEEGGKVEL